MSFSSDVKEELSRLNTFGNINFERIDPSDTVGSFKCNMDFKKTKGFKPVEKVEV